MFLLSNEDKLMESYIHAHLNNYLIEHNIISPNQSGFQIGVSTVNQLLYRQDRSLKALEECKEKQNSALRYKNSI